GRLNCRVRSPAEQGAGPTYAGPTYGGPACDANQPGRGALHPWGFELLDCGGRPVRMQPVLHQKCVVHGGDDGEDKGGSQEGGARDPHPAYGLDEQQQDEENRGHLGEGVGFAEEAGAKIAQAGNHEQHAADQQDGDVAAEHHDRIFPGNHPFDREHKKHSTHQQLVGDGVEILAEQGLLMQGAGQQAIEAVAHSGENEQRQRTFEIVLDQIDDDEGQENHAQERELVGRSQDLPVVHRSFSPWEGSPPALARNSLTRSGAGSCPVFCAKRWASERMLPSGRSSSILSTRCMGKKTTPEVKGSPLLICEARSSKEATSTLRRLRPSAERWRIAPQNFSRGLAKVAITSAPGRKGLTACGS